MERSNTSHSRIQSCQNVVHCQSPVHNPPLFLTSQSACKALATYSLQCTPQPVCHACLNCPKLTEEKDNGPLPPARPWLQLLPTAKKPHGRLPLLRRQQAAAHNIQKKKTQQAHKTQFSWFSAAAPRAYLTSYN